MYIKKNNAIAHLIAYSVSITLYALEANKFLWLALLQWSGMKPAIF